MKKFIIEDTEKNRILSLHKSYLNEDNGNPEASIKDQLQEFITKGCFPKTSKVVAMKSTNPKKTFAIKVESTKTPGKFRYYFIDNTVGQMENNSFTFLPNKWECDMNQVQQQIQSNNLATSASTENFNRFKKEGGWSTKDEIIALGDTLQNIENPTMYEKTVFNNINLYRRKSLSGISDSLTPDQKKIIDKWKDKGYKFKNELDGEELETWVSQVVSPASKGFFPQDLVMYFNPANVQGLESGDNITTVIQSAVDNRIPTDKKDCKQTIEAYYLSWKKKRPLEPNEFNALKAKAQACKNEFNGEWGIGGGNTDDIIKLLTGKTPGGPAIHGEEDGKKWRLN